MDAESHFAQVLAAPDVRAACGRHGLVTETYGRGQVVWNAGMKFRKPAWQLPRPGQERIIGVP